MRELNVVLPGVIWPELADYARLSRELQAPNLLKMLTRASMTKVNYRYSDFYYQGITPAVEQSLAATYAKQLGLAADGNYLLAEPTFLRADRDRLLISEAELLQLNTEESATIIQTINKHFAGELKVRPITDELWLMELNFEVARLVSYPLIDIVGENIDDYLPAGPARLKLHQLLNELQMLLHSMPLNQVREQEGLLPVNSLWLWDKVPQPLALDWSQGLSSNPKFAGEPITNLAQQLVGATSVMIDSAYYPSCYRDHYAWLMAMAEIDKLLLPEIWRLLKRGSISRLNIWLPSVEHSALFSLGRFAWLKWWQTASWPQLINQL